MLRTISRELWSATDLLHCQCYARPADTSRIGMIFHNSGHRIGVADGTDHQQKGTGFLQNLLRSQASNGMLLQVLSNFPAIKLANKALMAQ